MKQCASVLVALATLAGCASAPSSQPEPATALQAASSQWQAGELLARSLPEISAALDRGETTSYALVKQYLARIEAVDRNGPALQAVLSVNPDALKVARELDALRAAGNVYGPLHGVPILLKDNIESRDALPTTAGALALQHNVTGRDSPLVAGLRAQGAIILGKTNLSQWANFRSEGSMSGWSALGGQVRNPHMLDRNPCGSSSGSGAAAAASLAAGTVGTETNGSIICPSTVNGIVGFKPTVGVVPQEYIVPISHSQDTAGPMTKTVKGAAMLMNGMAVATPEVDYTKSLHTNALQGVRVGILRFASGNNQEVGSLFTQALEQLEAAGAILVDIDERPASPDGYGSMSYDLLKFEFKAGINTYLASTDAQQVEPRSLAELIAYNQQHADTELALFDQSIFEASEAMSGLDSKEYRESVKLVQQTSRGNIDKLLSEHDVEVLVAPSGVLAPRVDAINGDVWPGSWPGYGSAAAHAGYPHITVPMGAVNALPVGLSFIAGQHQDASVLGFAYAYEQRAQQRQTPGYLPHAEALPHVKKAMNPAR